MADLRKWKHTGGYEVGETLPTIEEGDNGKVLGVSEGQYALVSGGGGGGSTPYFVEDTVHDPGSEVLTLNKKYSEILNAFLNGEHIVLKLATLEGFEYECLIAINDSGNDGGRITFYGDYEFDALSPDDYPTNNL